jgi:hypothetical protein
MQTSLSFLGLSLLVLHCAVSFASAQHGCTLIDNTMPAQYVSFERLEEVPSASDPEEKRGKVLLRFRNNTNCEVSLWSHQDPQDLRALAFKRRSDGSLEIRVVGPEDLPDGRRIELEYDIDYLQPLPPPKKVINFDRIVHSLRVRPGMSFIFAVPLSRFDYSIRIKVHSGMIGTSIFTRPHTALLLLTLICRWMSCKNKGVQPD